MFDSFPHVPEEMKSLSNQLAQERQHRISLEQQVQELTRRLDQLVQMPPNVSQQSGSGPPSGSNLPRVDMAAIPVSIATNKQHNKPDYTHGGPEITPNWQGMRARVSTLESQYPGNEIMGQHPGRADVRPRPRGSSLERGSVNYIERQFRDQPLQPTGAIPIQSYHQTSNPPQFGSGNMPQQQQNRRPRKTAQQNAGQFPTGAPPPYPFQNCPPVYGPPGSYLPSQASLGASQRLSQYGMSYQGFPQQQPGVQF